MNDQWPSHLAAPGTGKVHGRPDSWRKNNGRSVREAHIDMERRMVRRANRALFVEEMARAASSRITASEIQAGRDMERLLIAEAEREAEEMRNGSRQG